jgi:dipeptidyl aminopeptidase/acylaminoacyl peptidase
MAAAVVTTVLAQQAATRRFGLDDFSRIVRVGSPQFSPDAKSIAAVVSRANLDENRYDAELVLVDAVTAASKTLVSGRLSLSFPRWSPDGQRLGFLAQVGPSNQVFVIPRHGGEAKAITKTARGVQQFAWSPDSRTIAFSTPDEPPVKTGPERFNDSFEIFGSDFLQTAPIPPSHLWIVSADGGDARRLTSGSWTLPVTRPPGSPSSIIVWTPDGTRITISRQTPRGAVRIGPDGLQNVTVKDGSITPINLAGTHPVYSPDGKSIAFQTGGGILVAPAGGGVGRGMAQAIDRNMARVLWMPDGASLLLGANDSTRVSLWLKPLEGEPRKLDLGDVSPASSFFVDMGVGSDGAVVFAGSSPMRPAELYYKASVDAPVRRLTDLNGEIATLPLGRSEAFEWKSDEWTPNGIITYPPDFDPSQKYPLVLLIHGGPRSASLLNFSASAQLMAAKGWLVFQPNYRGSDNLGSRFSGAISNDQGAGPGRDVWAGMEIIKKRGIVDESRIGVSGWSYGGYMTVWMLGHYTGWRAAVAGASVTDLLDQYSLNDASGGRGAASPWVREDAMARMREQSPITSVSKIKTPTLIMSNTGDFRVPITESFKLFHALKDHGVTTQFIAYPIYGHNAADPVRQRDVQRRWIGWLEQHFGPPVTGGRH